MPAERVGHVVSFCQTVRRNARLADLVTFLNHRIVAYTRLKVPRYKRLSSCLMHVLELLTIKEGEGGGRGIETR